MHQIREIGMSLKCDLDKDDISPKDLILGPMEPAGGFRGETLIIFAYRDQVAKGISLSLASSTAARPPLETLMMKREHGPIKFAVPVRKTDS